MTTPLISICIPAYNCELFIKDTISCLKEQSYTNLELIIVDDGSTDTTRTIIEHIKDDRIIFIRTSHSGAAHARNIAYEHSSGSYVIFFDADDYVESDFVSRQYRMTGGNLDVVVLSAHGRFYNNDLKTFKLEPTPDKEMTLKEWVKCYWYHCNPMTPPGRIIIPKKLIDDAGLWNENLNLNDDLEFYTRIFSKSKKLIFNPDAIFYYRSGIKGLSGEKNSRAYESLYQSTILSIDSVLSKYPNESMVTKSCANLLQSLIYEIYPREKHLIALAESKINELDVPDFKFPAGGTTRILLYLFGWKTTKIIKNKIKKCRKN
jgi:glycosyltransferase involved in cell wall biosynthesis